MDTEHGTINILTTLKDSENICSTNKENGEKLGRRETNVLLNEKRNLCNNRDVKMVT